MKSVQYAVICSALLLPELARADFYIGTGAKYNVIPISSISYFDEYYTNISKDGTIESAPIYKRTRPDSYKDTGIGSGLSIGYQLDKSLALELSYFSISIHSRWTQDSLDIPEGIYEYMASDIKSDTLQANVIGSYQVPTMESLSLLGHIGVSYQKTNIRRNGKTKFCEGGECDENTYLSSEKNFYDTRLVFGTGLHYQINNQFGIRSMVGFMPSLSFSDSPSYSISTELLYTF